MKKLLLVLTCIAFLYTSHAQILYGTSFDGGVNGKGTITKLVTSTNTLSAAFTFEYPGGRYPYFSRVIQAADGKLYGMTNQGGQNSVGVIFSFDTSTNAYTTLKHFDGTTGSNPSGSLIRAADNKLYGMTTSGGASDKGVIFSFDPGTGTYTKLVDFNGGIGSYPNGDLTQAPNGKLYGMTDSGGVNNAGVLFSFDPLTNGYAKLFDFGGSNGSFPDGNLLLATNGKLYGMTNRGGLNPFGVIFTFDPNTNVYTKLYDFDGTNGSYPHGSLMQTADGKFYGLTSSGGSNSDGVIFTFDPNTNLYNKLYDFDGTNGRFPYGDLVKSTDNKLYGMASQGGSSGLGVIFSFDPSSIDYTKLVDFDNANGSTPFGSLTQASNGKLYGMTNFGGNNGNGVIFSYTPSDNTYTKLGNFAMNSTGSNMYGGVIAANDSKLYGMTNGAGGFGLGCIFSFDPFSSVFSKLVDFNDDNGSNPTGRLLQASDGKLYGMTFSGGSNNDGVIFSYNPVARVYTKLMDFNSANGANPNGSLMQATDGKLYGMTVRGGSKDSGVIFSFDPVTNDYVKLKDLNNTDGDNPIGDLMQASDGKLYGMTSAGGTIGAGVIFSLDLVSNTYTKLMDFDGSTNGATPLNSFIQASDGKLYSTAYLGGNNGVGVLFSFDPNTNVYEKLYDFDGTNGAYATSKLMQASDGKFYSTTFFGGANQLGVAYSFDPATSTFTKVADFDGTNGQNPYITFFTELSCTTPSTFYRDADGDGYGNIDSTVQSCTAPPGYVANSTDCNDSNATIHPGAPEICDGIDNNCNGKIDEGFSKITYYRDADHDGYGDPAVFIKSCSLPAGYVGNKKDCDDADASRHPGALDICDGIDNDCDGAIDEDCRAVTIADAMVTEGNKNQKSMNFSVTLNKASTQTITVNYNTQGGSALPGSDFVAQSGTVTFLPTVKKVYVSIAINGDKLIEPDETFSVNLSSPVNATIADGEGKGTITNDDGITLKAQTAPAAITTFINTSAQLTPNPATNRVYVSLKGYTGIVTINLMSLKGELLLQKKVPTTSIQLVQPSIDVSRFASGVYMVVITDEQSGRRTEKLIIQH